MDGGTAGGECNWRQKVNNLDFSHRPAVIHWQKHSSGRLIEILYVRISCSNNCCSSHANLFETSAKNLCFSRLWWEIIKRKVNDMRESNIWEFGRNSELTCSFNFWPIIQRWYVFHRKIILKCKIWEGSLVVIQLDKTACKTVNPSRVSAEEERNTAAPSKTGVPFEPPDYNYYYYMTVSLEFVFAVLIITFKTYDLLTSWFSSQPSIFIYIYIYGTISAYLPGSKQ